MTAPHSSAVPGRGTSPLLQELSTSGEIRRSRLALYATWLSLALVLAVFVLSVLYMSRLYRANELQAVSQSAVLMAETADARLSSTREAVSRFAYGIRASGPGDKAQTRARHLMSAREEITEISLLDNRGRSVRSFASGLAFEPISLPEGSALASEGSRQTLELARKSDTALFSSPYFIKGSPAPYIDLIVPAASGQFVSARLSLASFLKLIIPSALSDRAHLSLEMDGNEIYMPSAPVARTQKGFRLQLPPLPASVRVLISPYSKPFLFAKDISSLAILGLGITLLASVLGLVVFQLRQRQTSMRLLAESVVRQAMSESISSGMKVTDMEGRVAYVNRAYKSLFRIDGESVIGRILPPQLPSGKSPEPGAPSRTETKMERSDGSLFDALLEVTPLTDRAGKQIGWMEMVSDITEDKRIARELARSRDRITKVLDSIDSAVSVLGMRNEKAELLYANPTYSSLFGSDPAPHRALMPSSAQGAAPAGSSAEQLQYGERWFEVRERELIWTDGMSASLQIATDITEQRRNEELMAQQEKKAELSSRLVTMGEMASSLAHELNQPLGAIANYASAALTLLQSGKLAQDSCATAFEKISHQAERAATIIRRIRSFAKRTAPEMTRVPVARIIEETMELALIQAKKRRAVIREEVRDGIPDIICDAVMVEQLLLNLLKNAMEAAIPCPDHTVTLKVYPDAGQTVVFEVSDRGPGIPDAVKEKLFEPFFSTKPDGMGIGLNICRSIAEMHRGRLRVEDNPGGGTVFRLTLPADGS